MKNKRQSEIIRLISEFNIDTQEELKSKLAENGYIATQATVSRDMRELKIIKASDGKGNFKYVCHVPVSDRALKSRYSTVLREAVKSVDTAMQIVVVNVYTGMAGAAGAAIDSFVDISGVVGSVAGDDTLIIITKSPEVADNVCQYIKDSLK